MNNVAIVLTEPQERWHRDEAGHVKSVVCRCGQPVYYKGAIHSRLVLPAEGTALCKKCRGMVRVPVGYVDSVVY
jgi:hypothetical protein